MPAYWLVEDDGSGGAIVHQHALRVAGDGYRSYELQRSVPLVDLAAATYDRPRATTWCQVVAGPENPPFGGPRRW